MNNQKPQPNGRREKMRLNEILFNAAAFLLSILLVGGALAIYFVALPDLGEKSRGIFLFIISWQLVIAALLGATAVLNFARGEFSFAGTIVQIVAYAATLWLLPFAIWGIVALVLQSKREKG